MSLKFGRVQPWTAELAALDQFKKSFIREYSKYFDDLLSGERSLPFGLLVFILPSSSIYSRLIAGIRAKMKDETTYLQTHAMAYELLNSAHRFSMAKQLTAKILRIRTSLPFADNMYFVVHLQSLSFVCALIVRSVITRICL